MSGSLSGLEEAWESRCHELSGNKKGRKATEACYDLCWSENCKLLNVARMWEKEMATHSSTLAWKISWMGEPGGLQSMGLQRVRHDWVTSLSFFLSYYISNRMSKSFCYLLARCHGSQFDFKLIGLRRE